MKILFLTPYNPAPPNFGGAIRIYYILKYLAAHHDVTVAGFGSPVEQKIMEKHFPELKGKIYYVPKNESKFFIWISFLKSVLSGRSHWHTMTQKPGMQKLLDRLVKENDFDIIQSEFPCMAEYNLASGARKVLDAHNVESDNFQRMASKSPKFFQRVYYRLEAKKMYREETEIASRQDAIFACSERDIKLFDNVVPDVPKYLIPNGVDLDHFQKDRELPEPDSLVFVGMMKYPPNKDAMNYFLDEVFLKIKTRIPEAKIYIVGSRPETSLLQRANKYVEVTGFVDDVRPYINRAAVYVVPLRMGGGTRLKIIEAMAMKKPLVTTSIGCEGIDLVHKESAMIADNADRFADSVVELLQDRKLRKDLSEKAYRLAEEKYSWQVVGKKIQLAYHEKTKTPDTKNPGREPGSEEERELAEDASLKD